MPKVTVRVLLVCCGVAVAVLLGAVAVIPFTRELGVGLVNGEPIGKDGRPLSYHVRRLSDPNPEVVDEALSGISRFGERGAPAIPALIDLARDPERGERRGRRSSMSGEKATLRESAIDTIGAMEAAGAPAVPGLVPFLTHPDPETRYEVLRTFDRIGPAAFADPAPICAVLDDPGSDGYYAQGILGRHAPEALKAEIRRRLDPGVPVPVRLRGCELAGDYGGESRDLVVPLRAAMANDPDPEVRKAARKALVALGLDPDAPDLR